jgi:hypothetical protein
MFTDPITVTYDGTAYSLPRTGISKHESFYRTADGTLGLGITSSYGRAGRRTAGIRLQRRLPDPTPADVFDNYRDIINAVSIGYQFDTTRAGLSDIPLLRTALLALVDTTFQSRVISEEK